MFQQHSSVPGAQLGLKKCRVSLNLYWQQGAMDVFELRDNIMEVSGSK